MRLIKWAVWGVILISIIAVAIIVVNRRSDYFMKGAQGWEMLDTGAFLIPSGDTQTGAAYLYNKDTEKLRQMLNQAGINTDILKTVSFSNNTIVLLVRQWIPLKLKSVTVINHSARIVEWDYLDEPYPAPAIPVGKSICKVIVLKIPKSNKVNVIRVRKK